MRLRDDLKERRFTPVPVREKLIPKANGKMRRLGIPTTADRIVQAAAKLVESRMRGDMHVRFGGQAALCPEFTRTEGFSAGTKDTQGI